jgi:hypothetical protein
MPCIVHAYKTSIMWKTLRSAISLSNFQAPLDYGYSSLLVLVWPSALK